MLLFDYHLTFDWNWDVSVEFKYLRMINYRTFLSWKDDK